MKLLPAHIIVTVWAACRARRFDGIATDVLQQFVEWAAHGAQDTTAADAEATDRLRSLERPAFVRLLREAEELQDSDGALSTDHQAAIRLEEANDLALIRDEIGRRSGASPTF